MVMRHGDFPAFFTFSSSGSRDPCRHPRDSVAGLPNSIPEKPNLGLSKLNSVLMKPNLDLAELNSILSKPNSIPGKPNLVLHNPNSVLPKPNFGLAKLNSVLTKPGFVSEKQSSVSSGLDSGGIGPQTRSFMIRPCCHWQTKTAGHSSA